MMGDVKINPSDLISGEQYLRFIADYKEYDKKQKELIESLRKEIEMLKWEKENLKEFIKDNSGNFPTKLLKKVKNQQAELRDLQLRVRELRKENERLLCENLKLKKETTE